MDLSEITARLAVLDLYGRYAHSVDSADPEAYGSLFAPDGVLEVGDTSAVGPSGTSALMRGIFETLPPEFLPYRHHLTSARIEITGQDSVRGSTYFACITPDGLDHWGIYTDEIRKCDDEWLFARRTVTVEGAVAGSPMARLV